MAGGFVFETALRQKMEGGVDRELIAKAISIAILVAAVLGIIYPAFIDPNISLTQIVVSLFHPDHSFGFVARWIVVIVFFISLYAVVVGHMYRSTPITILSSNIEIKYLDQAGTRVRLTRTQTLRANQRRVTAFFMKHGPSAPDGRVLRNEISVSAFNDAKKLNNTCEIYGQETRSIEVMQLFESPLPYAWFMPLAPVWLIGGEYERVPRFFRKYIVKRTNTVVYANEFNIEPVMQFQADVYPSKNVVLTFDFSASALPPEQSIRGMRIKNYGVVPIQQEYLQAERKFVFRLNALQSERVRITWAAPAAA
jgi:hypothetical protein